MSKHLTLLGCGCGVTPTLLSKDTFTGPNGTDLTSHTPDFGPAWTTDGTTQLQGGQLISTGATEAWIDLGHADVTIDFDATTTGDPQSFLGIYFRMIDAGHTYVAGYYFVDSALELYDVNDSGFTLVANAVIAQIPGTYHFKIVLAGSSVTVLMSGPQSASLQYNMGDFLTNTKCGIFFNNSNVDSFDNWQVTTP